MFALKLSRAAGARVILSSSSDEKLAKVKARYPSPPILTVNYNKTPNWEDEVIRLTKGAGVDIVIENGGAPSLVQSIKCTRRGGVVSQVRYLGKQDPSKLKELIPVIIDRRVTLRYGIPLRCCEKSTVCDRGLWNAGVSMLGRNSTWKTSARPCRQARHSLTTLLTRCSRLTVLRTRCSSSGRASRWGKLFFASEEGSVFSFRVDKLRTRTQMTLLFDCLVPCPIAVSPDDNSIIYWAGSARDRQYVLAGVEVALSHGRTFSNGRCVLKPGVDRGSEAE